MILYCQWHNHISDSALGYLLPLVPTEDGHKMHRKHFMISDYNFMNTMKTFHDYLLQFHEYNENIS